MRINKQFYFQNILPEKSDREISFLVYVNYEIGEDIKSLFRKITIVGKISNPDARDFGTSVYLCEDSVGSFNEFWSRKIRVIS